MRLLLTSLRPRLLPALLLAACTADLPEKQDSQPAPTDDADQDGYSVEDGDCNDADADFSPGAIESCDGLDNDCDGQIDDEALTTFYTDADADGYGDPAAPVEACNQPADAVSNAQDCDDSQASVFPGSAEVCDGLDNDCDGTADDGVQEAQRYYTDSDGDTWGDGPGVASCTPLAGSVTRDGDCDDQDGAIHPGAPEYCDGLDTDCDGIADDEALDRDTFYADFDGDGYGDAGDAIYDCAAPAGYTADDTDCDDRDGSVYPAAPETCDGVDNDCDGSTDETGAASPTWYLDNDGDGHGNPARSYTACAAPPGYVAAGDDCADTDAAIHPGAPELCDGADNDCDGTVDEGSVGVPWYQDSDGDGYGDASAALSACVAPAGYVADDTDCDDGDGGIYPGADEWCDGDDNDCDGTVDESAVDTTAWYPDADADGYGDAQAAPTDACAAPAGFVDNADDCDDADPLTALDCGGFTGFDGTTGAAWEQRQDVYGGTMGMSLITYQTDDIPYIYNMMGSTVLRYDTATDTWSPTAAAIPFSSTSWANFSPWDGYLWGIRAGSVWRYDPIADSFAQMATVSQTEDVPATETDEDGNVYGHSGDGNLIIYDGMTGAVRYVPTGLGSQYETRLAYDPTTRNLYFGAFFGANLYAYNLDTGAITLATTHPEGFLNDIVCSDRSGHIYAAGSSGGTTFYQYTTATGTWAQIPAFPVDHGNNGSCTVTWDGWLYASAGSPNNLYRIRLY